jgi:very-short-patch-repair endonuclease
MTQVGEDEDQFTTTDAESILDVCLAHFRPTRQLRWHYRSQHHSLIAFSNHYFYRNLIVFPSPYGHSSQLGVRATYLADAVYEDQTNYKEAIRAVDAVVDHIRSRPNESLGVATLNLKQRDLIAELLDERLQTVSGADTYREKWISEAQPLFIKNLENVQGDERDAIVISTTFGKSIGAEAVRQNFGPISRQGGWRRLNVLFTRAKKSIALFTSMRPEDIVVDASTPEGTKALRNYLEYARTGSLAVAEETGLGPESDFETSVIDVLKLRGYEVTPQLGVAGYRIDIAVKHPEYPGVYLAAIECDGASYHSAVSVRDRDRIRQEILESMGWRGRIWRIWSTDWFRMPRQEAGKLVGFLEELRKTWKPEHSSGQSWVEIGTRGEASDAGGSRSTDLEAIKSTLLDFGDDLAVRVGDIVRYADLRKVDDILTVQITEDKTDLGAGLVHRGTPLAQTFLGGVAGDDVTMQQPGASARTFRIIEVKRPKT